MELQDIKISGNDGPASSQATDHVDGTAKRTGASEREALLSQQAHGNNAEMLLSAEAAARRPLAKANAIETSCSGRVKREMDTVLCSRVRLWMVVLGIMVLIIAVISIAVIVCSAMREDEDDKFDPSLFTVPLYFRGSFKLPNLDLSHLVQSNSSKQLAEDLEGMITSLFQSSPALGRYFSGVQINYLGNGSVIVNYQLRFLMPEDEQEQLTRFTLSRDTACSVFRQFLYEQEPRESERLYIEPASLSMS
ncbi:TPA-induced transmembrane protein [Betta splendens]|uniref:TPA-induced transmembrane protein n=1 Tax=Betta splendens TaxID=158456 RepID=A0A6P7PDQ9_BETSP|nr:TPA-induced transmembrane protein [Betta splendens]